MSTPFAVTLAEQAAADPDRPALTDATRTVTRAELDARTNRLARAYAELGVVQDSFVTIGLPNGIEWFEAAIAVWKLGATPAPVSAKLPGSSSRRSSSSPIPRSSSASTRPGRTCIPAGFAPDPALSDAPLPAKVATAWKAPTSGGSTGRPKLIVAGRPGDQRVGRADRARVRHDTRTACTSRPGRCTTTVRSRSRSARCSWATTS